MFELPDVSSLDLSVRFQITSLEREIDELKDIEQLKLITKFYLREIKLKEFYLKQCTRDNISIAMERTNSAYQALIQEDSADNDTLRSVDMDK